PEFRSELHDAKSLAVAFWLRLAKIPHDPLLCVSSFLVPDDSDGAAIESRETSHDRFVVAKGAVAVKLHEVGQHQVDVVERIGPLRMAGDLCPLPRSEVSIELFAEISDLLAQPLELRLGIFVSGQLAKFFHVLLQTVDLALSRSRDVLFGFRL